MTIESVSRALSRLSAKRLIRFAEKGRRDIEIPELSALAAFVQGGAAQARLLQ
jgi:CRP/FNR family transcriptional regulator